MKYALILLFNFVMSYAWAQTTFSKHVWINEPEMPVNVVDLSIQPSSGIVWLCTNDALLKYNGKVLSKIYDTCNSKFTAITTTGNHVYVGYHNGKIAIVKGDSLIHLQFRNTLIRSTIKAIYPINEVMMVIATEDEGLYLSLYNNLFTINNLHGLADNYVSDIVWNKNKLIACTDNGFSTISFNKTIQIENYGTEHGLQDDITTCIAAIPNHQRYWIGTQQAGVFVYDDSKKNLLNFKNSTPWNYGAVNDILVLNDSSAWAITDLSYILSIKLQADSLIIKATKQANTKLHKIKKDAADNLWCATNKGLLMLTGIYLTDFKLSSHFKLQDYTSMTCDSLGVLWFTQGKKLYSLNTSNNNSPTFAITLPADITCLYSSTKNTIWIGTYGKGLFKYHTTTNQLQPIENSPTLINSHILSITQRKQELWVASFNGIDVLNITTEALPVNHFNKHNGVGTDYVYQLQADEKNTIWMATDGAGIVSFNSGVFTQWDSSLGINSTVFYNVTSDNKESVWASSFDKGLYKYDGKRWHLVNLKDGLQDPNITAIAAQNNANIIVVHKRGIDQWVAKDQQFRHINRRLGLGIDSTSKSLNCITSDCFGNVFVPYEEGIMMFSASEKNTTILPKIEIVKQGLFFKNLLPFQRDFASEDNHISFTFEGVSTINSEPLHYRYKLEGYDSTWIYTNETSVSFAQLNSGSYIFRVQVSLSDNFNKAHEDIMTFNIAKPFWQSIWFILSTSILSVSIVYMIIRKRESNIIRLNQLEREKHIYEYEHLKSQVKPHFLFNSFNTLINIIEEDKETALEYTVHLSDFYRNILSYKDKDLIPLHEELSILQSYIYIQTCRFGEALLIDINIDEEVQKSKLIMPLAIQILVENCIKHNVVSCAQPLHIFIYSSNDEIVVKNHLQPKITKEKSIGIGTENIRKRYRLLTKRPVYFNSTHNDYIVKLPLL